jgi:hypothetical protein
MGIGASVEMNSWTAAERAENERAVAVQNLFTSFIASHFFYSFPTRAGKQSDDPLSALWVEVSMDDMKAIEANSDEATRKFNKVSS